MSNKKNRHFSTRIMIRTAALLFFTIVISTVFSCWYVSRLFKKQVLNAYSAALENTSAHLSFLQREIQNYAGQVAGDLSVQEILHTEANQATHQQTRNFWAMRSILTRYRAQTDYVENIDIVTDDGNFFTTRAGSAEEVSAELERQGVAEATDGHPSRFSGVYHTAEGDTLLYKIEINSIISNESNYASMYIWVHSALFERVIENTPSPEQIVFLLDSGSRILLSSEKNGELLNTGFNGILGEGDNFLLYNSSLMEGWTLVLSIPNNAITSQIRILLLFFVGLGIILSLVVLLVMVPILISIMQPISELSRAAKEISLGNFDTKVNIVSGDELEILGQSFNEMTVNLKRQFRQIVFDEDIKNDLRIALLMAQINPHFIYNTLNSIIYLASAKKSDEVVSITRSFASILQKNLKIGEDGAYATISEELETVRNYMVIQQLRYPERFQLNIEAEPSVEDIIVPRLLLQPLVENAIFHGILATGQRGEINVSVAKDGNNVCINIDDNGAGMDASRIQQILEGKQERKSPAQMNSIGISNIRERLRLSYGDNQLFLIRAKPGGGVSVSIRLPATAKVI